MEPMTDSQRHGTRSCYVRKRCRCGACRFANLEYSRQRTKLIVELAEKTALPTKMGLRTWSSLTGLEYDRVQQRMCSGREGKGCPRKRYLKRDSKGSLCDYCREGLLSYMELVPATKSRRHLKKLSRLGIGLRSVQDLSEISRSSLHKIKIGKTKKVAPETESAILEICQPEKASSVCEKCDLSHHKKDRLQRLACMLPCAVQDVFEAYPCTYPKVLNRGKGIMECRMLFRDLHELGAKPVRGTWAPEAAKQVPSSV